MYLKGGLSKKGCDRTALKKLNHELVGTWKLFKKEYSDPALGNFDQAIPQLNRFEDIRYPGPKLDKGMIAVINYPRGVTVRPLDRSRTYELSVAAIDELVAQLFKTVGANPVVFLAGSFLQPIAREYLKKTTWRTY